MKRMLGCNVFLAVISHARAANVPKIEKMVGPATWFVGEGEAAAYKQQGAKHVVESGPLCRSRNAAIDAAMKLPCVELSDDLVRIQRAVMGERKLVGVDIEFEEAVSCVIGGIERVGVAKLGGAAPTNNPFYANVDAPIHPGAFIVGDFIVVMPGCNLRFDETMTLKEDYDYTIQHIMTYGAVARRDDVLMTFAHRKNAGGAVAVRTPELEQHNIDILKSKWPGFVVDNPRRPDEVLLKLPKMQRMVADG